MASVHCNTLDDEDGCKTFLDYRRFPPVGGKFRVVVTWKGPAEAGGDARPWSDSDRETKLRTFPFLPHLLSALSDDAQDKIDASEIQTEKIIETVKRIINHESKK